MKRRIFFMFLFVITISLGLTQNIFAEKENNENTYTLDKEQVYREMYSAMYGLSFPYSETSTSVEEDFYTFYVDKYLKDDSSNVSTDIRSKKSSSVNMPDPTTIIPGGEKCEKNKIITENLKRGARDGKYSTYNKGIVTQVAVLQAHMNRLLKDEYGNEASGPVDGVFGPLTEKGVFRLQIRLNQLLQEMTPLAIDGIVGPFTKNAINYSC